jgi:glucose-6-phosphate isomerase
MPFNGISIVLTSCHLSLWQRFQQYFLYYRDLGWMKLPDDFFKKMQPQIDNAFAGMRGLKAGAINPTEKRIVGHYCLQNTALAPTPEIRTEIEETIEEIKTFVADYLHLRVLHGDEPVDDQFSYAD